MFEYETVARLRADLSDARQRATDAMAENAQLRQIVSVETPIAAFDLATSWRAERALLHEEIAALRAAGNALLSTAEAWDALTGASLDAIGAAADAVAQARATWRALEEGAEQ